MLPCCLQTNGFIQAADAQDILGQRYVNSNFRHGSESHNPSDLVLRPKVVHPKFSFGSYANISLGSGFKVVQKIYKVW